MLCFVALSVTASNAISQRLNLECSAMEFTVQSELNRPLAIGEVRAADLSKVGFLKTDSYSLKLTTQCEGKKENKVCISLADSHYCPNPSGSFRVKSVSDGNDLLMIKSRCTGKWAKYKKISSTDDSENYLEDEVYFQLKNQIYAGVNIAQKPVLRIYSSPDSPTAKVEIISFRRDLWRVNEYDPLVGRLKVNTEGYEKDAHDKFSVTGVCSKI